MIDLLKKTSYNKIVIYSERMVAMSKILIVYYSRKGENYFNDSIKSIDKGNTEIVAEYVQKAVGGDLFEVETVRSYSEDYTKCTEEAKQELNENARPELKAYPDNFENHDVIFVGYPNWWGTMPMCMFTLLEKYDLSGKTIIPFCTNEGSGMGASERDLKRICNGAEIKKGLSIHGSKADSSESQVAQWVKNLI